MDDLQQLIQVDWWYVLIAIMLFLFCVKIVWSLLDWLFVEKLGVQTKKARQHKEEVELLKATSELAKTTSENLDKLKERHTEDERAFRTELTAYMEENNKSLQNLQNKMTELAENRISDQEQSLEIQKELKDSVSSRDAQIEALVIANKELLAEEINKKYKHYLDINGIPADEYDDFGLLHDAYKGLGGNHNGDSRFQYCIDHLPIIPVKTELMLKGNNN